MTTLDYMFIYIYTCKIVSWVRFSIERARIIGRRVTAKPLHWLANAGFDSVPGRT